MIDQFLAVAILAAAYGGVLTTTNLAGAWRRPAVCAAAALGTGAYIAWRFATADDGLAAGGAQRVFTIACLVFETIFVAEFWTFLLLASRSLDRSPQADRYEAALRRVSIDAIPTVDVFIATYNEEFAVLEKSIIGSLALDYPKVTVHVLDDGNREWVRELCERVGAHYIARPDNTNKKAGNHNYALACTDAPFIAMMDADFVPISKTTCFSRRSCRMSSGFSLTISCRAATHGEWRSTVDRRQSCAAKRSRRLAGSCAATRPRTMPPRWQCSPRDTAPPILTSS